MLLKHCSLCSLAFMYIFYSKHLSVNPFLGLSTPSAGAPHNNTGSSLLQEEIIRLQLDKPPEGGLGFSVIGGERGIFVKSVTPGGEADASAQLRVGDRLLRVGCVRMADYR